MKLSDEIAAVPVAELTREQRAAYRRMIEIVLELFERWETGALDE
jgi:hypothetical protein